MFRRQRQLATHAPTTAIVVRTYRNARQVIPMGAPLPTYSMQKGEQVAVWIVTGIIYVIMYSRTGRNTRALLFALA